MSEQKPQKVLTTSFDLDNVPENERFSAWKESFSVIFDVSLVEKTDERGFRTRMTNSHLGSMLLGTLASPRQYFHRSRKLIAQTGIDHILVQVYLHGGENGRFGKTDLTLAPGDVFILDLGQTVESLAEDFDILTLVIPRQMFEQHLRAPETLHGQVLRRKSPLGQALGQHLRTLWQFVPTATVEDANALAKGVVGLIVAYFGHIAPQEDSPEIQMATRQSIRHYINRHLADPQLTPTALAARFRISRTYLYRLFEHEGGISRYIREQRLMRSLNELIKPENRKKRVADIAFSLGFADEAHFSRLFRHTFGFTPGEARHSVSLQDICGNVTDNRLDRRYEEWLRKL
jgi:AraC-like DNA-binding protein